MSVTKAQKVVHTHISSYIESLLEDVIDYASNDMSYDDKGHYKFLSMFGLTKQMVTDVVLSFDLENR